MDAIADMALVSEVALIEGAFGVDGEASGAAVDERNDGLDHPIV